MGNMSYCRFQNTLPDLRDCFENWDDLDEAEARVEPHGNTGQEIRCRVQLLKLCKQIVDNYGDDDDEG